MLFLDALVFCGSLTRGSFVLVSAVSFIFTSDFSASRGVALGLASRILLGSRPLLVGAVSGAD